MEAACGARSLAISVQDTGKELCRGAHSRILEVVYGGLRCRAKRIEPGSAEKVSESVVAACAVLSRLRHPNVVQFLGTQLVGEGSPAIVTEYLLHSLGKVLERHGSLPELLTHSILRDAASALVYLHDLSPPVAHGHLVPANLLLTEDFKAKLSDVGVSRCVLSQGNLPRESAAYLPSPPNESPATKTDVFSLGAVMVHAVGGTHPASLTSGGERPLGKSLGVAERHPLSGLMRDCLQPEPGRRPTAAQLQSRVSQEAAKFPPLSMESRLALVQGMKGGGSSPSHPLTSSKRPIFSPKRMLQGSAEGDRNLSLVIESEALKLEADELRVANRGLRAALEKQMKFVSAHDHEMAAKLMAKDQEIVARRQELTAQTALTKAAEENLAAKTATNRGLCLQLRSLQDYLASRAEPHLLNPKVQLKWKKCSDLPHGMIFGQAITVRDKVYFGSGTSHLGEASSTPRVLCYSAVQDCWNSLSQCPVVGFGMGCYLGELALVGGAYGSPDEGASLLTGDVHLLDEGRGEWRKTLPPLLKPRMLSTIISHSRGLVAAGGIVLDATHDHCLSSVEVFEDGQWHRAAPLPIACIGMTSAVIGDCCYLLGGFTDTELDRPTTHVFSASLSCLVQDAIGCRAGLSNGSLEEASGSIWSELVSSPRYASTAANLGNCLLTLGGSDEHLEHKSGALHVFSPLTNSWIRIEDIPVSCFACAVAKLSGGDLLIIGGMGHDEEDALRSVYRAQLLLN